MADIIIIRPGSHSWDEEKYMRYVTVPHGPLHLAAPLVKAGYKVKIIDEVVEENPEEELRKEFKNNPICVGISSMTGHQITNGLKFAKIVKEESDVPVIWGGAHSTILPETTLAYPLVDIVVYGDGEKTFLELASALKKKKTLKGIPGVGYKENGKIYFNEKRELTNLDEIPELPFQLIKMEKYITSEKKKGITRYFSLPCSRGCPYQCRFCQNSVYNNRWRTKSVPKIIEELKFLIKNYRIDGLTFEDEMFSLDKQRIAEICQAVIKEGLKIKLRAGFRINHFSQCQDSFIELMKRAGFIHFGFGVEAGSERILEYINKGINLKQIYDVIEKIKKYGFLATYNFMTGFPTETKEEFKETLKLIYKIFETNQKMIYPVSGPSFYTPFPGTKLYYEVIKSGFKPPEKLEDWKEFDYNYVNMSWLDKGLVEFMHKAREVVNNLNQKFIGEEAEITSRDFKPLKELIDN